MSNGVPRARQELARGLGALPGGDELRFEDRSRIDRIAPPGSHVSDYWDCNVYKRLRIASGVSKS